MKPLILHIGTDRTLLHSRVTGMLPHFNVRATSPEKAVFAMLEGHFDRVVICSSVNQAGIESLLRFIRRIDGNVPVVVTGAYAGEVIPGLQVADGSLSGLLACLAGPARAKVVPMPALRSAAMAS